MWVLVSRTHFIRPLHTFVAVPMVQLLKMLAINDSREVVGGQHCKVRPQVGLVPCYGSSLLLHDDHQTRSLEPTPLLERLCHSIKIHKNQGAPYPKPYTALILAGLNAFRSSLTHISSVLSRKTYLAGAQRILLTLSIVHLGSRRLRLSLCCSWS
jgi:hypothetical protein